MKFREKGRIPLGLSYITAFQKTGKQEIEQFLTALAVKRHVAASTQNQALAALLLLYKDVLEFDPGWLDDVVRAKPPQRLPTVLTHKETGALLGALRGPLGREPRW